MKAIGTFRYRKRLADEIGEVPCEVKVFPLLVKQQRESWPEMEERELRWLEPGEASAVVEEEDLQRLIKTFAAKKTRSSTEV